MTMLAHARSPQMLQGQDTRDASASVGTPHLAMIGRFFKFALGMLLFIAVVSAIMAVRVIAWFPHFHQ